MRLAAPFCRVTVLTPHTRADLAMPTDVPVAELVPMLTEQLLEPVATRPTQTRPHVWCLAAVAGAELPSDATLGMLGVLDGDLLRLRLRAAAPAPPVFDDPVDAVACAGDELTANGPTPLAMRPWVGHAAQRTALAVAAVAAPGAALAIGAARGSDPQPSWAAMALAATAAAVTFWLAAVVARRRGAAAVPLALAAVGLAAVTGWAAVPGSPGPAHLLLAVAVGGATAAAALAVTRSGVAVHVALVTVAALAGCALAVAALLGYPTGGPATALAGGLGATAAAVALAMAPLLPRLAARFAALPPPVIIGDAGELLRADDGSSERGVDAPEELLRRTALAHSCLAGLVGGTAVVAAVGAVLAGLSGGWSGPTFAVVVVTGLLLRSRGYASAAPVVSLLVAGLGAAAVLGAAVITNSSQTPRLIAGFVLLVVAAAAALLGGAPAARPSPVLRRATDITEALVVVAAFPLALAVLDLYRAVRLL